MYWLPQPAQSAGAVSVGTAHGVTHGVYGACGARQWDVRGEAVGAGLGGAGAAVGEPELRG